MDGHIITAHKDKQILQIQWIFFYHGYVKEQNYTTATIIKHGILHFRFHFWYDDSLVTLLKWEFLKLKYYIYIYIMGDCTESTTAYEIQ